MSGIQLVCQVPWLYHLSTGHLYCLVFECSVFRWLVFSFLSSAMEHSKTREITLRAVVLNKLTISKAIDTSLTTPSVFWTGLTKLLTKTLWRSENWPFEFRLFLKVWFGMVGVLSKTFQRFELFSFRFWMASAYRSSSDLLSNIWMPNMFVIRIPTVLNSYELPTFSFRVMKQT